MFILDAQDADISDNIYVDKTKGVDTSKHFNPVLPYCARV